MKKIFSLLAVILLASLLSTTAIAKYIPGYGDCDDNETLTTWKQEIKDAKEANTAAYQIWSQPKIYGPADWDNVRDAIDDSADISLQNGAVIDDDVRVEINNVNLAAMRARGLMNRGCGNSTKTAATISDSARIAMRMQFCKNDLLALKDTCDLMGAAGIPSSQVQTYQKAAWARMDSTIQVQLAILAGNANVDELAAKLVARGYHFYNGRSSFDPDDYNLVTGDSLLVVINAYDSRFQAMDQRVEALESWQHETTDKMETFATQDWVKSSFKSK